MMGGWGWRTRRIREGRYFYSTVGVLGWASWRRGIGEERRGTCIVPSVCVSENARTIIFIILVTNWNGRRKEGKVWEFGIG